MPLRKTLSMLALLLAWVTPAWAAQLNEIRVDQPGGDVNEYVELRGDPGESLDGLTFLVIGDGTGGSGVIETNGVVDLTGQTIPSDGIFLVAESAWSPDVDLVVMLGFENGDNTTHLLVRDFTGAAGDDLDLDDDCVLDSTPWSALVDGVALVEEDNPPTGTECHYGAAVGAQVGPFVPGHVYRCGDDWFSGGFPFGTDDTPGAGNTNCPVGTHERTWGQVKTGF